MMKRSLRWQVGMLLLGLLLAACGGNVRVGEAVRYDFGHVSGGTAAMPLPLAGVSVRPASWLAGTAMHYRLAYAEPLRRQAYGESRWAAPPGELLATLLKRRLVSTPIEAGVTGCRLQVALEEMEQRFDDVHSSQAVIVLGAQLFPARGTEVLARRTLRGERPAATADARGGAAATRDAALALGEELAAWLAAMAREKPAIVERCRI